MFQRNALNRATPELSTARMGAGPSPGKQGQRVRYGAASSSSQRLTDRTSHLPSSSATSTSGDRTDWLSSIPAGGRFSTAATAPPGPTSRRLSAWGPTASVVDFAASCVIACVNTQRRDAMAKRAKGAYAWQLAASEVDPELEIRSEMIVEAARSLEQLDTEIRRRTSTTPSLSAPTTDSARSCRSSKTTAAAPSPGTTCGRTWPRGGRRSDPPTVSPAATCISCSTSRFATTR